MEELAKFAGKEGIELPDEALNMVSGGYYGVDGLPKRIIGG